MDNLTSIEDEVDMEPDIEMTPGDSYKELEENEDYSIIDDNSDAEVDGFDETGLEDDNRSRKKSLKSKLKPIFKHCGYDRKEKKFCFGKFRISRKLVIILLIILLIICLFAMCSISAKKKMQSAMAPQDVTVERRTVTKRVTGSSVIEPKDSYSIMSITTGEIISDYINEGDTVNKGDKLYQFDPETPQNSVDTAQNAVKKAEQNYSDAVKAKSQTSKTNNKSLQSAQIAVDKARQSYNDALETLNDLSVKSDISGIVGEIFVQSGDNIMAGGSIATVYNDRYMKIQLPFNENDAQNISVGDSATLTIAGTGNEIWGGVSSISSSSVATSDHNMVRYVTIEAENPGALTSSDRATAMINGVACNDAGQFEYIHEYTISADASGKIAQLNIEKNDYIYSGQSIATLDSNTAQSAANTARLTLNDAMLTLERTVISSDEYSQDSAIKTARLALDDARLALEKAQKGLNDYTITAPISGTVVTKNSKAGDKVDSSNATTPMCIIYDMSSVQFDLDVDEADIAGVKVGQNVVVTADAVSGVEFKGVVEKVSVNGVASNGVTNYPVTIAIYDYGALLPGMNVDAEIEVEKAENVLAVPVSSLNRGNTVYVKGDKDSNDDNAPEGYKTVTVETGLSDENYIEIKSGLSEGTLVRGQELDTSSDFEKMMNERMSESRQHMQNGGPSGGAPGGER
ncbi:MAG: efflux RND transporter periplasmic adaptor subunit [Oscillospiraceae bacterium]|nr:efflux RND transporter periplasmic adaptor subunit [Oscillospiraceae bacterium]